MILDIGIDLGTFQTIVYIPKQGIVFDQPSVIAYNKKTKDIIAIGNKAYEMIGKTPKNIETVRPILNGVICNYNFAEKLLFCILKSVSHLHILKPRLAICVPAIVTDVERNAIIDAAVYIGARKVFMIDEPVAAAIGEGIDISLPKGRLVIDIGGGSSDIALLSLNGIVVKDSIRIAGDNFDNEIIKVLNNKYNLKIGVNSARIVKETLGSVVINNKKDNLNMVVKGKDGLTGLPRKQIIYTADFLSSFEILANQIIEKIKKVIENTPPDLLGDLQNEYVLMTGGGSLLRGLKEKVEKEIKLKIKVPDNPMKSVGIGTGKCFEFIKQLDDGLIERDAYKK